MSDLISREDIKKLTKQMYLEIAPTKYDVHTISDCTSYVASKCRQYINEHLNDLQPVEQTEWISVKDRLPEKRGEYYVSVRYECDDGTQFDDVTTCYFWKNHGVWNDADDWLGKIVAWQPITEPSPYKGE